MHARDRAIHRTGIQLRPATIADRCAIYDWMACSDLTTSIAGPPLFPEVPISTWGEFCADYAEFFFDGSQPESGRSFIIEHEGEAVGHISYDCRHLPPEVAELDIWLRDSSYFGRGFGRRAIDALCRHLGETLGKRELIMRPSARNPRAIAAYNAAGFRVLDISEREQADRYGSGEYHDTIVMQRLME